MRCNIASPSQRDRLRFINLTTANITVKGINIQCVRVCQNRAEGVKPAMYKSNLSLGG